MIRMAEKKNEPQSYGSQSEWVRGDVGQDVNRLEGNLNSQKSDFYESRESESGVSPEQIAGNQQPSGVSLDEGEPVQKVTDAESGAKRDGYFKKRDYK